MVTKRKLKKLLKKGKRLAKEIGKSALRILGITAIMAASIIILVSIIVFSPMLHESYLISILSPSVVKITNINNYDTGG